MGVVNALRDILSFKICDDCGRRKPKFLMPVANWHGIYLCRKCYNEEMGNDPDYYVYFNPLMDFIALSKDRRRATLMEAAS